MIELEIVTPIAASYKEVKWVFYGWWGFNFGTTKLQFHDLDQF